jgi:hypothetical protein
LNNLLGQVALCTHRADKASEFFQRSLAASPKAIGVHLGLGLAWAIRTSPAPRCCRRRPAAPEATWW